MAFVGTLRSPKGLDYEVQFDHEPSPEDIDYASNLILESESQVRQDTVETIGNAAVQGMLGLAPSVVGGAGAVAEMVTPGKDFTGLRRAADELRGEIEQTFPVNPALKDKPIVKAPAAVGQGLGFLGATLATGGGAAIPLAMGGLAGAEQGAQTAEQLGMTGFRKGLMTVGGAAAEVISERIGGVGGKNFLKGKGGALRRGATAVGTEAVEEPAAGFLHDVVQDAASLGTDIPMVNPLRPKERLEETIYGAIGAGPFGALAALTKPPPNVSFFTMIDGKRTQVSARDIQALGLDPSVIEVVTNLDDTGKAAVEAAPPGSKDTVATVLAGAANPLDYTDEQRRADVDAIVNPPAEAPPVETPRVSNRLQEERDRVAKQLEGLPDDDPARQYFEETLADLDAQVQRQQAVEVTAPEEVPPVGTSSPGAEGSALAEAADLDTSVTGEATGSSAPLVSTTPKVSTEPEGVKPVSAEAAVPLADYTEGLGDTVPDPNTDLEGFLDVAERERSAKDVDAVPPENPLTEKQVADHLKERHGIDPDKVTIINRPGLAGWGFKYKGRVYINAPWLDDTRKLDEVLYHEAVHLVEKLPQTKADVEEVMRTVPEEEIKKLEEHLKEARYDPSEFPNEKAAFTLSQMAQRFRERPAFQRIVQQVKTYFKETFGRTLNQRDAEVIAARVVARGLKAIREEQQTNEALQFAKPVARGPRNNEPVIKRTDIGRNSDFAKVPSDEDVYAALDISRKPKFGKLRSVAPGTEIDVRIDIPTFERTVKTGNPVYAQAGHERVGERTIGAPIGYDTKVRIEGPFRFFVHEEQSNNIRDGKITKKPVATVRGKYAADQSRPADIDEWTPAGYDPKDHPFFYDKRTDAEIIGGEDAFSVGNTVFVKKPEYASKRQAEQPQFAKPRPAKPKPAKPKVKAPAGSIAAELQFAAPRRGQVFGDPRGPLNTPAEMSPVRKVIRDKFFDSTQPITAPLIARVRGMVTSLLDPEIAKKDIALIKAELAPTDQNLGAGVFHEELMRFAQRLVKERGDSSLFDYMLENLNRIVIDEAGNTFRDIGQVLAGRSAYTLSPFMKAVKDIANDKDKATEETLGPEVIEEIEKAEEKVKLDEEEIRDIGDTEGANGNTIRDITEEAAARAVDNAEAAEEEVAGEEEEVAAEEVTESEVAEEEESREIKSAKKILDKFARAQSDTPSMEGKKPVDEDRVRKAVNAALKKDAPFSDNEAAHKDNLAGTLEGLGVPSVLARTLAETTWTEKKHIAQINARRKAAREEAKKKEEAAAREEEESRETKSAKKILDKLAKAQSDTPSLKGEKPVDEDEVRKAVTAAMKSDAPLSNNEAAHKKALTEKLTDLGVDPVLARTLAETVWTEKKHIAAVSARKAAEREEAKAEKAAERAAKKAAEAAAKEVARKSREMESADKLVDQFARVQSDTPTAEQRKQKFPDKVRQAVRDALKKNAPHSENEGAHKAVLKSVLESLGVDPNTARVLADMVWTQRKSNAAILAAQGPTLTAEKLIEDFAKVQSDTMEAEKKKAEADPVRQAVREAMKKTAPNSDNEAKFKADLTTKLIKLGVAADRAAVLAQEVWTQKRHNEAIDAADIKSSRTASNLALGKKGSLRPLEIALSEATLAQQRDPAWRKATFEKYFKQMGLSEAQAKAAARLYEHEFVNRLADAAAKLIDKQVKKSAPWQKRFKKVGDKLKDKMNKELEMVKAAIRSGLMDPSKSWKNALAEAAGWRGFTGAQYQRLAQIDEQLSKPGLFDYQIAALLEEITDIVSKAKVPDSRANLIVSYYTASALSGLSTFFVQFSAHNALIRDYLGDLTRDPVVATKAFMTAISNAMNETAFALKTDVYSHQVADHLKSYEKPLKRYFEDGLKDFQSKNPVTKARGLWKLTAGSMVYSHRLLNSVDQGFISTAQVYKTTIFTHQVLKQLGLTRDESGKLIEEAMRAKQNAYEDGLKQGMGHLESVVRANEVFMRELYQVVLVKGGAEGEQLAEDIKTGAEREAMGMVGRLSADVPSNRNMDGEGGEGNVSTLVNAILQGVSDHMLGKGGYEALKARAIFGFVTIPFRTARWYAGYTPYGYVRYMVHRSAVKKGKISPYQQSYGSQVQVRQRLRDATLGTLLGVMAWALSASTGDDDPDKEEFRFFVTGKGPDDEITRDAWLKRFKPYALVMKLGKSYVPLNLGRAFEAIAWPLAYAGAIDDTRLKKKGALARSHLRSFPDAPELFGAYFGSLSQRSSFQGLNKIFEIGKGFGSGRAGTDLANVAAFSASALIPWKGALSSVTRLISTPVERNTLLGAIYSNTPVIGPLLGKPSLNTLGDPVQDQTIAGKMYSAGFPVTIRVPLDPESRKAYDIILKKGRGPSAARRNDLEKIYGPMRDNQFYDYAKARGKALKAAIIKDADRIKGMDDERFAEYIERISRRVNPMAAREVGLKKPSRSSLVPQEGEEP